MSDSMEIDDLVQNLEHSASLNWRPKHFFLKDINRILEEIIKYELITSIDIYNVCIACSPDLTWDSNYYISQDDLKWFKNAGRKEFINYLADYYKLDTQTAIHAIQLYRKISDMHVKLCELFELQLE